MNENEILLQQQLLLQLLLLILPIKTAGKEISKHHTCTKTSIDVSFLVKNTIETKLINTRSLFYQHTYTQSKHPSIPESFLSLHPRVVVGHDANTHTHTHTRKRTFLGRFKLHSNTHTHIHMLARRLSSKQAAVVCVKARRISLDQRRPDLFRTRLCSNK